MLMYCGKDCCRECDRLSEYSGCERCQGHPFCGS